MKHDLKWNDNAQLEHRIDDVLRATIESKQVDAYLKNFPGLEAPEYK